MKKMKSLCAVMALVLTPVVLTAADRTGLRDEIAALAGGVDAGVGVAVIFPDGDTLTLNGDRDFPLMSVFKFHQALAVCDWLRHRGIPLTEKVEVAPGDLEENTWSPLRDAHPEGGSFSYAELMTFTLVSSDNNACDILFRKTLGVGPVQQYVESLGIGGFSLECNESMMHEDLANCYRNMSTPMSAARLMEKFWQMRDDDEYTRFIWDTMTQCDTGHGRIPARIMGRAAAIAHKTGTGDALPDGRVIAVNDAGAVVLPDGRCLFLAVFVSDAACDMAGCEALIADVAAAVYAAAVYAAAVSASGLLP